MAEDGTYTVKIECSNCDWKGNKSIPLGEPTAKHMTCPNCMCKTAGKIMKRSRTDKVNVIPLTPPNEWRAQYRVLNKDGEIRN